MDRSYRLLFLVMSLGCATAPREGSGAAACDGTTFVAVTNHLRQPIDVYTSTRGAAAGTVAPGSRVEFPITPGARISFRYERADTELPREARSRVQTQYLCR